MGAFPPEHPNQNEHHRDGDYDAWDEESLLHGLLPASPREDSSLPVGFPSDIVENAVDYSRLAGKIDGLSEDLLTAEQMNQNTQWFQTVFSWVYTIDAQTAPITK